jgi:HPt (histidine-containing phosphotransfer) domain-containing protein
MDKVLTKPAHLNTIKNIIQQFIPNNNETSAEPMPSVTQESSLPTVGGLGIDLPNTEEELFLLQEFPLFDIQITQMLFGEMYESIVPDLLQEMVTLIPTDKVEITAAFMENDWQSVEELAHRTKGGAATCGAVRMRYACQYLERYRKAGHTKSLEQLYYQLIRVLDETKEFLEDWLHKHHAIN